MSAITTAGITIPARPLTWLITGCSSGFGLSLTRIALANGHKVIATSRSPAKTPDLVKEVEGLGERWIELDVTSSSTPSIIQSLEQEGTAVDVLVNNAGYSVWAPVECTKEEDIRGMMETSYFGPIRLIQAVLPGMRARKFGTIVNISSGASLEAGESMALYGGTKAALDGVTRTLAKEVAPFNVRTLTVIPGTFNTEFNTLSRVSNQVIDAEALPDAYKGTTTEKFINHIGSGHLLPNGDKDKAMQLLFEVVVGQGRGKGLESERILPLGKDMIPRFKGTAEKMTHALEVFGDMAESVVPDRVG